MKKEFADIQYVQIREYKYAQWFNEVQYNTMRPISTQRNYINHDKMRLLKAK